MTIWRNSPPSNESQHRNRQMIIRNEQRNMQMAIHKFYLFWAVDPQEAEIY